MVFRKPQLVPIVFIVIAFSTLAGLGVWQVQRLQWKNGMIANVETAQTLPALGNLPQNLDGLDYRNVMLTGTFMHDKAMHMVGRPEGMAPGFYLVTPFKLDDDGRVILVNRGYAPKDRESKPEGVVSVSGIIRPAREKRPFSPANHAEKNVWFYEDMDAMSKAAGVTLTPVVVEAVGKPEKDVYPMPSDGKISLRNDHLNYAITWFLLAAISLIMFAAYHYEKPKTIVAKENDPA